MKYSFTMNDKYFRFNIGIFSIIGVDYMSATAVNKISNGGSGSRCVEGFQPKYIVDLKYCVTVAEVEDWVLRKPGSEILSLYSGDSSTDLKHFIAFPYVDSCVVVICYMADKKIIATHLSSYDFELGDVNNGNVIRKFVDEVVAGKSVLKACIFGDTKTWFPFEKGAQVGLPNWGGLCVLHKDRVDAIFDVFCGKLIINDYLPDRDFRNPIPDGFTEVQVYS